MKPRKMLSLLLTLAMLFTSLPAFTLTAEAADPTDYGQIRAIMRQPRRITTASHQPTPLTMTRSWHGSRMSVTTIPILTVSVVTRSFFPMTSTSLITMEADRRRLVFICRNP
jgi:hypothetical protein